MTLMRNIQPGIVRGLPTVASANKGFTLIELLVVIAIIGLLASVVLVSLNNSRAKSRDARRLADVRQAVTALNLYYNDFNGFPVASGSDPTGMVATYMSRWPTAPQPADGACASSVYTYAHTGTGYTSPMGGTVYPDFTLVFCLGGTTGAYSSGSHTASSKGIQ
jgi:prepilin-type N-terminal cleavage/methylation domain-containing protein